jgi:hypothetical protein
MPYHKTKIEKGILGTPEKIIEEVLEYKDSIDQNCTIMAQIELSDIYGALESLAEKHNLTMNDLKIMSDITKSAFKDGSRS